MNHMIRLFLNRLTLWPFQEACVWRSTLINKPLQPTWCHSAQSLDLFFMRSKPSLCTKSTTIFSFWRLFKFTVVLFKHCLNKNQIAQLVKDIPNIKPSQVQSACVVCVPPNGKLGLCWKKFHFICTLKPLKVSCFGICNEDNKEQVNYLSDVGHSIGVDGKNCHGSNNVINMLHHHLSTFGVEEKHVFFHADNCGGQNKNKNVIGYLLWRVAVGLHEFISLQFM